MAIGKVGQVTGVNRETPLATERSVDKPEAKKDPRVMNAAQMYEKQFLREMVKAMRGTVSFGDMTKPSMAEEIYRGQLDEEYVEAWGDGGGLGLADLIHDEIMAKVLAQADRSAKPNGPIPLSDRDIARVMRAPSIKVEEPGLSKQAAFRVELKSDISGAPAKVQAPFDAKVLAQTRVDGKATVLLEHEGGMRSALIFDGVASTLKPGDQIAQGTSVGTLSPDAKSFFWNLNSRPGADSRHVDKAVISASSMPGVEAVVDPAKNSGPVEGR